MQSVLIELIVGYIASDFMPFTDFVNYFDWNTKTLSNTTSERTLVNLYCTSRAWAHFARYVLRRRIVIVDGSPGLRRLFARIDQEDLGSEKGQSAPIRPWVREIYFTGGSGGEADPTKHVSQLLDRLFRLCPNVEGLFLQTTFKEDGFEPFLPVIHSLGDFHHLKALWLRHLRGLRYYAVPNLSEFLAVLPRLRELQMLYVEGWAPFDFDETISRRRLNAPSHGTDPDFSPPETLKTISLTKVQTGFGSTGCDPQAFKWLLSAVDSCKYRPTALVFEIQELQLSISFTDYAGSNTLLKCAQNLMASITDLRLSHYYQHHQFTLSIALRNCKALESLSIILRAWAGSRNDRTFAAPPGVAADDISQLLLPLPALPDTVRTVHIHLEYPAGKWNLEDDVERDRLLVAQMRRLPHVKRFIISRPPLGGDNESTSSPIQTLDMTREYCASVGIEFSVLDSFSPPFF